MSGGFYKALAKQLKHVSEMKGPLPQSKQCYNSLNHHFFLCICFWAGIMLILNIVT